MLPQILNWTIIVELVLGLAGLIIGFLIAKSTEEELSPGKKIFTISKRIILLLLIAIILLNLDTQKETFILIIISLLSLGIIIINLKPKGYYSEIANYSFFIIDYFLLPQNNQPLRLVFLSLLFIYGLFSGTLLYTILRDQNQKLKPIKDGKKEKKPR